MTMLRRLLASLHAAVFDTSPDAGLAFFVRHPDGVAWTVRDETLIASVGSRTHRYPLHLLTIGQLAGQMVLDGFEVEGLSPEFSSLSASVLIDGAGDTRQSNGDRLFAFRDLLRSLMGGYARELRAAKNQIGEALKQMVISQAESEWLDLWGALYNTPRAPGMQDSSYQRLIPEEAFRLRVNALAIEKAVLDLTGQRITIEEPWNNMFRLDFSRLSSPHRLYDGSTVGYHLIRPVANKSIVWDGIHEIVERNKAAGVIVLPSEERNREWVRDPLTGKIWFQHTDLQGVLVKASTLPRLDDSLLLSNYEIDRNYLAAITSTYMLTSVPDQLNSSSAEATRWDIQGWPVVGPQDQTVVTSHAGFYASILVKAYPDGGQDRWHGFVGGVGCLAGGLLSAHIDGRTISEAMQGLDWTIPPSWDERTWGDGADLSDYE